MHFHHIQAVLALFLFMILFFCCCLYWIVQPKTDRKGGERGDDMQQRAKGRILQYMGHLLYFDASIHFLRRAAEEVAQRSEIGGRLSCVCLYLHKVDDIQLYAN